MNKLPKRLLVCAGFLSLGLGVVGVFVPILPTVPFVLLASWCFMHSSRRFHTWILNHRHFGPIIRGFQEEKAISKGIKTRAILLLWTSILATIIFAINALWLRLLLLGIAVGVTIHILSFKTKKPNPDREI